MHGFLLKIQTTIIQNFTHFLTADTRNGKVAESKQNMINFLIFSTKTGIKLLKTTLMILHPIDVNNKNE